MEEIRQRKIYQRWWFWVLAGIIVIAIIASLGGDDTQPNDNTQLGEQTQDLLPDGDIDGTNADDDAQGTNMEENGITGGKQRPDGGTDEANNPTMTLAEFNSLKTGMTYDEAVKIIGGGGTLSSESEVAGIKTSMYTWDGEGDFGANANAMFQDGKLVQKAQFGLK